MSSARIAACHMASSGSDVSSSTPRPRRHLTPARLGGSLELGAVSRRRARRRRVFRERLLALLLAGVVVVACAFYTGRASAAFHPLATAICETGARWHAAGTYQGGYGIYAGTWDWWAGELGLLARYPDANLAPPRVQTRVASYGYRRIAGRWPGHCA